MATGTAHPREGWGETGVTFHSPKHVKQHCDGNLIQFTEKIPLRKYLENKSSFAIARDELLFDYDEETIDDEEFILLLKKNVSRSPSFPVYINTTNNFDSEIMDPVQCKAEFRVEKNALRSVAETPDLRHRILNWISEN